MQLEVCRKCAKPKILRSTQENQSAMLTRVLMTEKYWLEVLSTHGKWLFKTAKPLFIGSIPIAASN